MLCSLNIRNIMPAKYQYSSPNSFYITLHDPTTIPDLRRTSVEVKAGYITTFFITPSQIVTSESAMSVSENKRDCRFHFEMKEQSNLTKWYTRSGCIFECQLKLAFEACGCIPWNYPQTQNNMEFCNFAKKPCFEKVMENITLMKNCHCPFDCVLSQYSYSISSTVLDVESFCEDFKETKGMENSISRILGGDFGTTFEIPVIYPPKFINRFEQIMYDKDIKNDAMCKERLKEMGIVRFQLATEIATRIKKTQRVTFTDQLSNIGILYL